MNKRFLPLSLLSIIIHCINCCSRGYYLSLPSGKCVPCPEGDKDCTNPHNKNKNLRRADYENLNTTQEIVNQFGKIITSDIFGKSIEFEKGMATFDIPGFRVKVELLSEVSFDNNGNIRFQIVNHFFQNMEKDDDNIYSTIKEHFENIIEANKGEYSVDYTILENLLGRDIANGEIGITLSIPENALIITIKTIIEVLENEVTVGVKFTITPRTSIPTNQGSRTEEPEDDSSRESEKEAEKESEEETVKNSEEETVKESEHENVKESENENVKEPEHATQNQNNGILNFKNIGNSIAGAFRTAGEFISEATSDFVDSLKSIQITQNPGVQVAVVLGTVALALVGIFFGIVPIPI